MIVCKYMEIVYNPLMYRMNPVKYKGCTVNLKQKLLVEVCHDD